MEFNFEEIKRLAKSGCNMIPVAKSISADLTTPVAAFMLLKKKNEPSFLLESADGGEQVGRYSFLGTQPFATLKSHQGRLFYKSKGQELVEEPKDMMKRIGELLNQYKSVKIPDAPPFQGGAIGYVAYDAVAQLEDIPLPSVEPQANETNLMFFKNIITFDRLKHRMFLVSHIILDEEDLEAGYHRALDDIKSMEDSLFSSKNHLPACIMDQNADPVEVNSSMGKASFLEAVKKIKQYIRAGDIFQCVLSEQFQFKMDKDPFEVYRVLRNINPSPYLFYVDFIDEVLLGSSPEMLIRAADNTVETCPIAGTRPRGKTELQDKKLERDLMSSVKERAEHLMLVDLGRNDIGKVSKPGTVKVKDFMHVGRFSHVMHIISMVEGKLKRQYSAWDAFCACFPAGTLSGAPKIRAMKIISELEKARRGTYGGAVIAHDFLGNMNSCITIRSLWVKDRSATIQAGAGIVADSNPEKEYEEVLNKSKAIRKAVSATPNSRER